MARQIGINRDVRLRRATIARFDPCGAATVRCISVVALTWCFGCMPALRGHVEQDWPKTLQVAHAVGERSFVAGFPVDAYRAVTDWRATQPFAVVVVDGFPMRGLNERGPEPSPAPKPYGPWCVVFGRGLRVRANRIEPRQDLHVGDAVLLGGFFAPRDGLTPVDYAEVESSVIIGRLVGIPNAGRSGSPLYWVLVPPGDYHSFLGGPAASRTAAEGIRVWGAIAHVVPLQPYPWPLGTLLAVGKLSPRFGSGDVGGS